jgi:hypothetical protein
MDINKKQNYWSTDKNEQAGWNIKLPHPKTRDECRDLVDLYKSTSQIGSSLGTYTVRKKVISNQKKRNTIISKKLNKISWKKIIYFLLEYLM